MQTIKFGVLIPTRGDRPNFLKNCLAQIERQTLKHLINSCDLPNTDLTKFDNLEQVRFALSCL